MAEDLTTIQSSIEEIKYLLSNKKKEKSETVPTEIFTDPRFIELFESYFQPLIHSSKSIESNIKSKKNYSVFDVIGVNERTQESKRNALLKEIEKITDKLHNISKNIGNMKSFSLSEFFGITKTEKANNHRMINNAVRNLSLSINKTAKTLSDPSVIMKFVGIKPTKLPKDFGVEHVELPKPRVKASSKGSIKYIERDKSKLLPPATTVKDVVKMSPPVTVKTPSKKVPIGIKSATDITEKNTLKKSSKADKVVDNKPDVPVTKTEPVTTTPEITPTKEQNITQKASLSEKETAARAIVPVAIVDVGEEVRTWFEKVSGRGEGIVDKGQHTGTERESYSHSLNAIARLLTLGAALLGAGIPALISGLFDTGPLKGVKKIIASYSLQLVGHITKQIVRLATTIGGKTLGFIGTLFDAFKGTLSTKALQEIAEKGPVAKFFVRAAGALGKTALAKMGLQVAGWIGKFAKKLPGIGLLISLGFAANRFANGDIIGGLIDLGSGVASTIPIIGTAVAIGLDIWNAVRDVKSGGPKAAATKGWNKKIGDWITKGISTLLYNAITKLPFGDQIAKMLGITPEGTVAVFNGSTPEIARNEKLTAVRDKIKIAQDVKTKAEARKKDILKGRSEADLTETERAEYVNQNNIIARADKSIEDQRTIAQNVRVAPLAQSEEDKKVTNTEQGKEKGTENNAVQTPAASVEQEDDHQSSSQATTPVQPAEVRVERPYESLNVPKSQVPDETVSTLKQINTNLENMNRGNVASSESTQGNNIINVSSSSNNTTKSSTSPLQIVIESMRDTCYNNREKSRGMILDYRALA